MNKDINNIDPKLLEEDDRIVAYLKGQMTVEEELQFMKELEDNSDLKEKAIMTARLVKGLKQVGTEQDKDIKGVFLASREEGIETAIKQAFQMKEEKVSDDIIERANRMEKAAIHLATVMGIKIPDNADHMEAAAEIIEMFATSYTNYERQKPAAAMVGMPDDDELQKSAADNVSTPEVNISPEQKKSRPIPIRRVSSWLAIAASLVGVVWLGIGYNNYRHTTGLGEEFGNSFSSSMIVRGADAPSKAENKLERLFSDVQENKNIANTIHELSLCWEISQMETYNDYTEYSPEIGWHLAIAYLKDNNKKGAVRVLEQIVASTEKGSAISDKAKELLLKIK